eukprot:TRINITY_DN2538_c0_g1_i1.p1 TRINITY_DN2538_c0_g1~~TRINITY_DN2538_c0_g1_i1.p1  ORF type:complete len:413 (+),score=88.09 TRINITY_DN2538_c0_g1_i1:99-1337(+)
MAERPQIPKASGWRLPERYEVMSIIGSGSYGSVCDANDSKRDCNVAIKRMKHLFRDLVDCKRILRELAILNRLSHPHVIQIYDVIIPDSLNTFDEIFIVMEICDSDLKKLIKQDVTLLEDHIYTLLYNLLVGLKYLHSAGIYHRDLKPANVLCNQDCSVKIADFGLSRALGEEKQPHLQPLPNTPRDEEDAQMPRVPPTARAKRIMTQHVVTRWYRAPELILLQENYTAQIDVWSVGCIFGELLQMLEGANFQDRGPIFPGSTCFPLSPHRKHKNDYKYHTKGQEDQLNMIFKLLGTPSEAEVATLEREDAKRYLQCFEKRQGDGLKKVFPWVEDRALESLALMLKFRPEDRITVNQALEQPLLAKYRDPAIEVAASAYITLDFEKESDLPEDMLRKFFGTETERCRDRMQY